MSRGPFGESFLGPVRAGMRGLGYWWVVPLVLAFLPAILLSNVLLASISGVDWSCVRVEFGAPGSRYGGCSIIAGELITATAVLWLVPLFVFAALLYLRGAGNGRVARAGAALDGTGAFVRIVAVLVGLANAYAIKDPINVVGAPAGEPSVTLVGLLLLSVLAALAASEIVLRLGRPALDGGFLSRYGVAVLGLCLGGAFLGGSSWVTLGLLSYQPGAEGPESGVLFRLWGTLAYGSIAAVVGAVLGLLEGLILGIPLAAALGGPRRSPRNPGSASSADAS